MQLEKAASSAGLRHVFPAELPFPEADVLARWTLVLDEPRVTVLLDVADDVIEPGEGDAPAAGYAAFGDGWLRHFGVAPQWWGTGRAQRLYAEVLACSARQGTPTTSLWVLVDNTRARAFYERLGWRDAGVRDTEVFAPYPVKMQMVLDPPHAGT